MHKILYNKIWLFIALACSFTSCLKDKGYEDGQYGAIRGTAGQEYLSIPVASKNPNVLGLESKSGAQTVELFVASYDFVDPAAADISGTLVLNNALVTAADPTAIILPSSIYTLPTTNITVKAGQRVSDKFLISINTSTLDPTKKYGIGFTLSSVSKGGVAISSNLKDVVYLFTVKNKYDGIYTIRVRMDLPADRSADWTRTPFTYPFDIHLITTGPSSVKFFNTAFNAGFHPLQTPSASGFGSTEPLFVFDANDKLVSVANGVPNPSNGRAFAINPAVTTSRFDPATKTVYAAFIMTQPGFLPIPIFDTLTFKSKRP
jgi:hypothetical protein